MQKSAEGILNASVKRVLSMNARDVQGFYTPYGCIFEGWLLLNGLLQLVQITAQIYL